MKTKKLIELLQAEDPSGELECCIGNCDIHFISAEPAYWDGVLQVLQRDETSQYYNITGAKYTSKGTKIVIRPLSITDAICNDTELPIDYSELHSEERKKSYKEANDKTRKQMEKIEHDNELGLFLRWAKEEGNGMAGDTETLEEQAKVFFENNYSRNTPMPEHIKNATHKDKDGLVWHESYVTRRKIQWNEEVELSFDGMDWTINKRRK